MLRSDELVIDARYRIRWQRESNPGISIGVGKNRGVDADYFTRHIDEWAAGVSRIDGGVGLNKRLELAARHDVAAFGGNDASRDCCLKSERTAYREHPIANLHAVRIAQLGSRQ